MTTPPPDHTDPNGPPMAVRIVEGKRVTGTPQPDGGFLSADGTIFVTKSGVVEHGKVVGDRFLVQQDVGGQVLWGTRTPDGGFLSADGTTYVSGPGAEPEHGLTAPDGRFLVDGTTRVVDGRTVWGSLGDDGSFLSEDGHIYISPGGKIEYGKVEGNHFLTPRTVGGQVLWGGDTRDGGWLSQDGTVYVDKNGDPQHGITDPATKSFIPGGVAFTMPDGSTAYGVMDGDTFATADGKVLVLPDHTVVKGATDWKTGIFTPLPEPGEGTGTAGYFIGKDGVTHGTFRAADGALVLDDGSVVMTAHAWTVDLKQMDEAITFMKTQREAVLTHSQAITGQTGRVRSSWTSPASDSFDDVASQVGTALDNLYDLVGSVISQMRQTYDNYAQSEKTAVDNLTQ